MDIIISSTSAKPIYEQIADQIKNHIMQGLLKPDDPLPSMRKLAKDLHVSVITTQRVYDELVKDGFINVIPAKGAFVAVQNKDFILEEQRRRIEKHLLEVCTLAKQSNIGLDELTGTLRFLYEEE